MLANAGPARAAVFPILGDVALATIAEGGDAETANGFPVAAIPKDFRSLLAGQVSASTLLLVIGPVAMLRPSKPACGQHMVSTVSAW